MPLAAGLMQEMLWVVPVPPVPPVIVPVQIGHVIKRFGVSPGNPSVIQTLSNQLQLFEQPTALTFFNDAPNQMSGIGTTDAWGMLGQRAMGGFLLAAPGNGFLTGRPYIIAASGSITIPSSAANPTVNLVLNQNYFTILGQTISVKSDTIAVLPSPMVLSPNSAVAWSLFSNLNPTGPFGPGMLSSWTITISGVSNSGTAFSIPAIDPRAQREINMGIWSPDLYQLVRIQLSLGVQFGGNAGGSSFSATCTQFEIQQILGSGKTNVPQ